MASARLTLPALCLSASEVLAAIGSRHSAVGRAAVMALLLAGPCRADAPFQPQPGDLLFQDLDSGELCDAIEKVTEGIDGAEFSHVGIVAFDGEGRPVVIEAGGSVRETPLAAFLARSPDADGRPKVLVGRLDQPDWASRAVARAREHLGEPYDDEFRLDNGKWYCSELVYECYRDGDGHRLFELAPMTFKEPGSDEIQAVWRRYFAERRLPVPEGEPGCNPGGLSRSPRLRIVHAYGRPEGYRNP